MHDTDGRARLCRQQGDRHIDVCVQGTDDNVVPPVIVWTGFHRGDRSELVVLMLDGIMTQQVYKRVQQENILSWARATFQNNFFLV